MKATVEQRADELSNGVWVNDEDGVYRVYFGKLAFELFRASLAKQKNLQARNAELETALKEKTMKDCEHEDTEYIAAQRPKIDEPGNDAGFRCMDCGQWFEAEPPVKDRNDE